jgi:hypothetical protein
LLRPAVEAAAGVRIGSIASFRRTLFPPYSCFFINVRFRGDRLSLFKKRGYGTPYFPAAHATPEKQNKKRTKKNDERALSLEINLKKHPRCIFMKNETTSKWRRHNV